MSLLFRLIGGQGALVILRSGDAPGSHELGLVLEDPNGRRLKKQTQQIVLHEALNGGANIRTTLDFPVHEPGVFWLHVLIDGKRLTRMPFMVKIKRENPDDTPPKATRVKRAT